MEWQAGLRLVAYASERAFALQIRYQMSEDKDRRAEEREVNRLLCLDGWGAGPHGPGIDMRVRAR